MYYIKLIGRLKNLYCVLIYFSSTAFYLCLSYRYKVTVLTKNGKATTITLLSYVASHLLVYWFLSIVCYLYCLDFQPGSGRRGRWHRTATTIAISGWWVVHGLLKSSCTFLMFHIQSLKKTFSLIFPITTYLLQICCEIPNTKVIAKSIVDPEVDF